MRENHCPEKTRKDATDASQQAEGRGFDQELTTNVRWGSSESFAQPDFADPFGDRDEHDVHHSDSSHEERDPGNARQKVGEGAIDRVGGRRDGGLAGDGEVRLGRLGDVVGGE
jgi:hypothetical protein